MPSTKIHSYETNTTATPPNNTDDDSVLAFDVDGRDAKPMFATTTASLTGPPQKKVKGKNYVNVVRRHTVRLLSCPNCAQANVSTHTRNMATMRTWACVGVGVAVFFPLCWLPLVTDCLKQTNHYCPKCGAKVGRVKPFQ